MTQLELLALKPDEVAAMSQDELTRRLEPLFPAARAEYKGTRESTLTTSALPARAANRVDKQIAQLNAILNLAGAKPPSSTPPSSTQ